jgi:hypothetical protein
MNWVRGYAFTWLLSWFALLVLFLGDFAKKSLTGEAHGKDLVGSFFIALIVATLSLPVLFILRVVPESSTSSGVRLVRRVLFGVLCGLLLGSLLSALIAAGGKADAGTAPFLAAVGAIFGLVAGLVDSIALDDHANHANHAIHRTAAVDEDADDDATGPAS